MNRAGLRHLKRIFGRYAISEYAGYYVMHFNMKSYYADARQRPDKSKGYAGEAKVEPIDELKKAFGEFEDKIYFEFAQANHGANEKHHCRVKVSVQAVDENPDIFKHYNKDHFAFIRSNIENNKEQIKITGNDLHTLVLAELNRLGNTEWEVIQTEDGKAYQPVDELESPAAVAFYFMEILDTNKSADIQILNNRPVIPVSLIKEHNIDSLSSGNEVRGVDIQKYLKKRPSHTAAPQVN